MYIYNVILCLVRVTIVATENPTTLSRLIVNIHVAVNNIKVLSVTVEMQEWVPCAQLSSYTIFCTAVNSINILRLSWEVPDIIRF